MVIFHIYVYSDTYSKHILICDECWSLVYTNPVPDMNQWESTKTVFLKLLPQEMDGTYAINIVLNDLL